MYTKPLFSAMRVATEQSTCCWIYVNDAGIQTLLCEGNQPFPTCDIPQTAPFCTVSIGPVTITGQPY